MHTNQNSYLYLALYHIIVIHKRVHLTIIVVYMMSDFYLCISTCTDHPLLITNHHLFTLVLTRHLVIDTCLGLYLNSGIVTQYLLITNERSLLNVWYIPPRKRLCFPVHQYTPHPLDPGVLYLTPCVLHLLK